ncbi:hypothetical protein TNCV_1252831 [Trichonephila clavipes]|nr:hypothetical protein TNCV_1252831 [Trichonephila clavipes]
MRGGRLQVTKTIPEPIPQSSNFPTTLDYETTLISTSGNPNRKHLLQKERFQTTEQLWTQQTSISANPKTHNTLTAYLSSIQTDITDDATDDDEKMKHVGRK